MRSSEKFAAWGGTGQWKSARLDRFSLACPIGVSGRDEATCRGLLILHAKPVGMRATAPWSQLRNAQLHALPSFRPARALKPSWCRERSRGAQGG